VRHLYSEGQFEVMPISHGARILLVYPDSLDLPTPPRLYLNPPLLNLPWGWYRTAMGSAREGTVEHRPSQLKSH